nr:MAG: movement protein [Physalis chlorosis virus]
MMNKLIKLVGTHDSVGNSESPLLGIKSSSLYKDLGYFIKPSSFHVHRMESVYSLGPEHLAEGGLRICGVPLFDHIEVREVCRSNPRYRFMHIGAISIRIFGLFKKNANVSGTCFVFDGRWKNPSQSLISTHEFDLNEGQSTIISHPNFSFDMSDSNVDKILNVVLLINNLDMLDDSRPLALVTGTMYRMFESYIPETLMRSDLTSVAINAAPVDLMDFGIREGTDLNQAFAISSFTGAPSIGRSSINYKRFLVGNGKLTKLEFDRRSLRKLKENPVRSRFERTDIKEEEVVEEESLDQELDGRPNRRERINKRGGSDRLKGAGGAFASSSRHG